MAFKENIALILNNTPVDAAVTNGPLIQLIENVNYLWAVLQSMQLPSGNIQYGVTLAADTVVGAPVYFDVASKIYANAIAEINPQDGLPLPRANVWGVVIAKTTATTGDLLINGVAKLSLNAVTPSPVTAGTYYLATDTPGKLTRTRHSYAVPVLIHDGDGTVLLLREHGVGNNHDHLKHSLHCAPAGNHTPPAPGGRHVITSPSVLLPGWLPANHASFNGKAPAGAAFGYNMAADTNLRAIWFPLSANTFYLEWYKGLSQDVGGTAVPLGTDGLCVIDRHGIWWMSNCDGDVPWPRDYDTGSPSSYSDGPDIECPRTASMQLQLYVTRRNVGSNGNFVRSLRSDSPTLRVLCDGVPATSGDLLLQLALASERTTDAPGYDVVKEYDPATGVLKTGPVVEALYTTAPNVRLTGARTLTVPIDGTPQVLHFGPVEVAVNPLSSFELPVAAVRLDSVQQQFVNDVMYLGFRPGLTSSIRSQVDIPGDVGITNPKLSLRFRLLGTSIGTLPQLVLTYRRIPRETNGLVVPMTLPLTDTAITCTTVANLTAANQYVAAVSAEFSVAAGDTVLFTLKRNAGDSYLGEVGLLRQAAVIGA